jgi:acyl-CoA reductase-like NAD-dependent aldehyde dehydrogenase
LKAATMSMHMMAGLAGLDAAEGRVAALVARARAAQRMAEHYDQVRVDELVAAAGWAIMEPGRNRELAELAVLDTGIGNVEDKVRKNHRKTLGRCATCRARSRWASSPKTRPRAWWRSPGLWAWCAP